ncbi:unnamed protein product [Ectocarpus sp. 4 AP-2014]
MANVQANMYPVGGVQPAVAQSVGVAPAVQVQPVQPGQPQQGQTAPNHVILAWFSCLCCCWPIGLVAIYHSCNVDSQLAHGDFQGAILSSHNAEKASKVAIGVGVVFIIIAIIASL